MASAPADDSLAGELAAHWAEAVGEVGGTLGEVDADALVASASAAWADASARLELATRDGAVAELDARLAALTAQLTAQRSDVPMAVREHIRMQHDAHFAELEASVQRVRELESAPLLPAPECDAACVSELGRLAERNARIASELQRTAGALSEHVGKEQQLLEQLDRVIAIEARQCATQDMLGAPSGKRYANGERVAQGRALSRMEQHLTA